MVGHYSPSKCYGTALFTLQLCYNITGTVTTDDLACGHESDASVNETKEQAKSVSASQDAGGLCTHLQCTIIYNECIVIHDIVV